MKKVIRKVNEELGIVQVTIADERHYLFEDKDEKTGLPMIVDVPSVTWVCSFYPKGVFFYKWLAEKGWDEAEAIKSAAGDKGSKIHEAIEAINRGEEVKIDSRFLNRSSGELEELTLEECDALIAYIDWKKKTKPIQLLGEFTLRSKRHNIAGTLDYLYKLETDPDGTIRLLDFKSGQNTWPEHRLQLSAYKKMLVEMMLASEVEIDGLRFSEEVGPRDVKVILEILQVGYRKNKLGWKLTEYEDGWELFQAAQTIWASETGNAHPKKIDYPLIISPKVETQEIIEDKVVVVPPKKIKISKEELSEEISE